MNKSRASLWSVLLHLLPAFLIAGVFATVGILHVGSRVMVVRTGYELSKLQNENRELTRELDRLKLELATLKSPSRLEATARQQLDMAPPSANAVFTLANAPRLGRPGPELARPRAQASDASPRAAPAEASP